MKTIPERHRTMATILSFALLPLTGLATDIYLPSLPAMAGSLHATAAQIQLSILLFLITMGAGQLFVGALLDSFGRFHLSNTALFAFVLSSFVIALFPDIYVLYAMRLVQGAAVAIIVVAKRAYFLDCFSGEKLKRYISWFTIVWSTSPILAPFLGGYLQQAWGWKSNFYCLGIFTTAILVLTLVFSAETIPQRTSFQLKTIARVYVGMLKTPDFFLSLLLIGVTYSLLLVFAMTIPFIIQQVYGLSPVVTGYSALLSGAANMTGAIISSTIIDKPLKRKVAIAFSIQLPLSMGLIVLSGVGHASLYLLMACIILLHIGVGFIFNILYAYSLQRFSTNTGVVSGLTGGGLYVVTSIFSYGIVHLLPIHTMVWLGIADAFLILVDICLFSLFIRWKPNFIAADYTTF
jgi:MFS transporter, DHA1 family, multidrug resistance protein